MGKAKSKKKGTGKEKFFAIVIVLLLLTNVSTILYFMVVQDTVPAEDFPMSFEDLMASKEEYIGKTLTLSGFFVLAGGNPLMISDPMVFMNNSMGPDNYVSVTGRLLPTTAQSLVGKRCAMKGVVNWADAQAGLLEIDYHTVTESDTQINTGNNCNDSIIDIRDILDYVTIFDPTIDKYAVLYCGGIDGPNLYNRYWNGMTSMYLTLLMYGYEIPNIRVVYRDGTGNDNQIPVHAAADHTGLSGIFTDLATEMGSSDKLFVYITNHGYDGGFSVWDALYPPGGAYPITYTELNTWISAISMNSLIVVSQTCGSGSLIPVMSGPNRLLISACQAQGSSYGCDQEGPWDEFTFHLLSGLLQYQINGDPTPVFSDTNEDGYVSMTEAFIYAAFMDNREENPLLDDNGDGIGSKVWQWVTTDSVNGESIYL